MRRILRSRLPQRWHASVPEFGTEILVAMFAAALAVLARLAMVPWTGSAAPYALNFLGVLLATLLAGWKSGIITIILAQPLTAIYITPPLGSLRLGAPEFNGLILSTIAELALVLIIALYQREIDRASKALESQLSVRELLVAELNHRVKNTLSLVQSLAHQSFTSGRERAEALEAYEGRLLALAAAHDLLTRGNWEDASLRDLAQKALSPFQSQNRIAVDGPEWKLKPSSTVTVCLALHELATNAAKYGALSVPGGRVSLSWGLSDNDFREIRWIETEGPPVSPPSTSGFGTRMLRSGLARDLGANIHLEFAEEGLRCTIRFKDGPGR